MARCSRTYVSSALCSFSLSASLSCFAFDVKNIYSVLMLCIAISESLSSFCHPSTTALQWVWNVDPAAAAADAEETAPAASVDSNDRFRVLRTSCVWRSPSVRHGVRTSCPGVSGTEHTTTSKL